MKHHLANLRDLKIKMLTVTSVPPPPSAVTKYIKSPAQNSFRFLHLPRHKQLVLFYRLRPCPLNLETSMEGSEAASKLGITL